MRDCRFVMRWALAVFLAQFLVAGCSAPHNRPASSASATGAIGSAPAGRQPARTALVTGSMIPQPVDDQGRPTASTTTIYVVDRRTIDLLGGGSIGGTLSRLPYVQPMTR